jgi:hypothetical protein
MSSIEVCFILVLLKILTLWLSNLLTAGDRNFPGIPYIVKLLDLLEGESKFDGIIK